MGNAVSLHQWRDNNGLHLEVRNGGGVVNRVVAKEFVEVGPWIHFTVTMDSEGVLSYYKNGELTKQNASTIPVTTDRRDRLTIGCDNFSGALDEVMIYSRSLSAEEVKQIYLLSGGS